MVFHRQEMYLGLTASFGTVSIRASSYKTGLAAAEAGWRCGCGICDGALLVNMRAIQSLGRSSHAPSKAAAGDVAGLRMEYCRRMFRLVNLVCSPWCFLFFRLWIKLNRICSLPLPLRCLDSPPKVRLGGSESVCPPSQTRLGDDAGGEGWRVQTRTDRKLHSFCLAGQRTKQ